MPRYTPEHIARLQDEFRFPQDVLDIVEQQFLLLYDTWRRKGRVVQMSEEEVYAYCLQGAWEKAADFLESNERRSSYAQSARKVAAEFFGSESHDADPNFKAALRKIVTATRMYEKADIIR